MRDWLPFIVIRNFFTKLDRDEQMLILFPIGLVLIIILAFVAT